MKRHWITHSELQPVEPLTRWVHGAAGNQPWHQADRFIPSRPGPVAGKGYATLHVEFDGFTFRFTSPDEVRHCIDVLSQKVLPTALQLTADHAAGPNGHWLSRLPAAATPWRYREKAVVYLAEALKTLERELR